jgi:hypothetical protein
MQPLFPTSIAQSNELKKSIKFKGDNLRQYEIGRNPEQKVRSGLLNEQHIQGLRWDRLVDSLKIGSLGK